MRQCRVLQARRAGIRLRRGSAGTRHTCILFACHGEMQWSRTRRAQQGARLAARRRRPLFFCEMSVVLIISLLAQASASLLPQAKSFTLRSNASRRMQSVSSHPLPSPFKKSEVFAAPPVPHRKHEHLDITLYIRVDPGFGHIIDVIAHEKLLISPTL